MPMENISPYLPGILLSYGAFLLAVASPGPAMLAILGTSMGAGRPAGIGLAMGVVGGSLTWGVLTAAGLSAILATYASALVVIKVFGGLYLLWLAYKAFRAAASPHDREISRAARGQRSTWEYGRRGYILAMTNPKSVLTWIAVVSMGLTPDSPLWVAAAIVTGTIILSAVINLSYALAFSTSMMIGFYTRARRGIQATVGTFFAIAGLRMLTDRN